VLTDELRELYQEVIIDHQQHPRNFGVLEQATNRGEGFNPLCGDRISLYVDMEGDRIRKVTFQGTGCAISTASASLMTEAIVGRTWDEAKAIWEQFRALVTGQAMHAADANDSPRVMKLRALAGVREFPVRVKCATLAWHTLLTALDKSRDEVVSTE
jgi:nitrogen fixation NifU-like protein